MTNQIPVNHILEQNNIKCEHCISPPGTRCESAVSNCPYRMIDQKIKLKDKLDDTKLE